MSKGQEKSTTGQTDYGDDGAANSKEEETMNQHKTWGLTRGKTHLKEEEGDVEGKGGDADKTCGLVDQKRRTYLVIMEWSLAWWG